MNPMEEKERRPIPAMQASRDVLLLNTTCISPSAGPTGSERCQFNQSFRVYVGSFVERSGSVVEC